MPYVSVPKMFRRDFLRSSLATTGVLSLGLRTLQSNAQEKPASTHWAMLSDLHISEDVTVNRGFTPYEQLQKAVLQVQQVNPEAVLISGDLARLEGLPGDYATLKTLLQPLLEQKPVCMALGNHDDRANFSQVFTEHPGEKQSVVNKIVLVVDAPPVRFLILDSLLYTNRVAGLLGKEQRTWLAEYLSRSDETPTLLVFHHPLHDTDGDLLDADKLFQIVTPYKQVKALIYGHSHVYSLEMRDGIHLINLPAVEYNIRDEDAVGWVEARLTADGGEFTLHAFSGNIAHDGQTVTLEWRT